MLNEFDEVVLKKLYDAEDPEDPSAPTSKNSKGM